MQRYKHEGEVVRVEKYSAGKQDGWCYYDPRGKYLGYLPNDKRAVVGANRRPAINTPHGVTEVPYDYLIVTFPDGTRKVLNEEQFLENSEIFPNPEDEKKLFIKWRPGDSQWCVETPERAFEGIMTDIMKDDSDTVYSIRQIRMTQAEYDVMPEHTGF